MKPDDYAEETKEKETTKKKSYVSKDEKAANTVQSIIAELNARTGFVDVFKRISPDVLDELTETLTILVKEKM